jgi:hypothetical protein
MRRPVPSASTRAVQSWLDRDPDFRELVRKVDDLVAIQRSLQQACPGAPLEVASLTAGTLAVRVPGAAWATRLRQIEPSLVAALAQAGFGIVRLKIQPKRSLPAVARPPAPRTPVPEEALAAFDALAGHLPESRLKGALATLLERQSRRSLRSR